MDFLHSLLVLIVAVYDVIISFFALILPYAALLGWVVFWLLGVDWVKFRRVLSEGGVVGLALPGLHRTFPLYHLSLHTLSRNCKVARILQMHYAL